MTAVEHIIAWIESSQPHYDRLLRLERSRNSGRSNTDLACEASSIAVSAYRDACECGDMFARDHSPTTILDAAKALLEWELEQ